jgi:hypothetical protein
MPVLGYFSVVGGLLLGLLFVADAYMPRVEHLSFASNLDGLPAAYKGEPAHVPAAAPHIAPPPAIAETTGSGGGLALAGEEPKRTPTVAAAPVAQEAPKAAKPKLVIRRRHVEPQEDNFGQFGRQDYGRQDYARQDYGRRQDFGFRSREPFGSREPSWRDSWASGAFQQPGEPRSRRSSRSGNDFGSFGSFGHFR